VVKKGLGLIVGRKKKSNVAPVPGAGCPV